MIRFMIINLTAKCTKIHNLLTQRQSPVNILIKSNNMKYFNDNLCLPCAAFTWLLQLSCGWQIVSRISALRTNSLRSHLKCKKIDKLCSKELNFQTSLSNFYLLTAEIASRSISSILSEFCQKGIVNGIQAMLGHLSNHFHLSSTCLLPFRRPLKNANDACRWILKFPFDTNSLRMVRRLIKADFSNVSMEFPRI